MKKHFYILSLSLILAIMSFSFSALATQRYVSPSGSDVIGNGSSSAPWLTIQHAVDNSVAGDVINLDEGTYVSSNVTVDKGLTIQGYNSIYIGYSPYAMRNRVFIVPAAEDGNVDNAFGNSAQNAFIIKSNGVTIKNLTINGRGNPLLTPGKNNFRAGIVTLDASQTGGGTWNNLLVSDVYIKYTWRRGISVYPYDVTGTIITGTRVDNVAYNQAMYLAGQSQAINDTVYNCFQGIVQNPNTTTPSGLIKATGNVFNGISNFPGCWGDLGGGNYSGQPRGLEFNNTLSPARTITYNHNTFTAFGDAAVGIYTVRADGNSQVDSNSVSFTSNGAQGLLIGWAYANGFSVSNNTVSVTGSSRGIYIFGSGTVAIPMLLENNILTGTGSTYSGPGEGTGIVITNLYLNGPDLDPSYVIIQNNNSITGFTRGIDLINNAGGGSPPELILTAQDNTIYGNSAYGLSNNTGVW